MSGLRAETNKSATHVHLVLDQAPVDHVVSRGHGFVGDDRITGSIDLDAAQAHLLGQQLIDAAASVELR